MKVNSFRKVKMDETLSGSTDS
ncbi:hypothetical protein NPIL_66771, partial [Nephila pilipes]